MKSTTKTNFYNYCKSYLNVFLNDKDEKNIKQGDGFHTETVYNESEKYVSFICKGDIVCKEFINEFDNLAKVCHDNNCSKLLFDMSGLNNPLPDWDRFKSGEAIADKLKGIRLASFSKASFTNSFTINVAYNRGMDIKVFTCKDEALKWLLS